jgi:hypothetical protein
MGFIPDSARVSFAFRNADTGSDSEAGAIGSKKPG